MQGTTKRIISMALVLAYALLLPTFIYAADKGPNFNTICEPNVIETETCSYECLDWDEQEVELCGNETYSICWNETQRICVGGYGNVCRNSTTYFEQCDITLYGGIVNYFDGQEYVPIERTITSSIDDIYDYEVTTGLYSAFFIENPSTAQSIKYTKDGISAFYQPMFLIYRGDTSQQEISNIYSQYETGFPEENRFIYPNAFLEGTNLTYEYKNIMLKENYIIGDKSDLPEPASWIGDNVYLELHHLLSYDNDVNMYIDGNLFDGKSWATTDKKIEFKNSENNTVLYFPKPYAVDFIGNKIYINYTFRYQNKKTYIYWQVPYEWLNDSSRVYPVEIDPSITLDVVDTEILDDVVVSNANMIFEDRGELRRFNIDGGGSSYSWFRGGHDTETTRKNVSSLYWELKLDGWYQPLNTSEIGIEIYDCGSATTLTPKIYEGNRTHPLTLNYTGSPVACAVGTMELTTEWYRPKISTYYWYGWEADDLVEISSDEGSESGDYVYNETSDWVTYNNVAIDGVAVTRRTGTEPSRVLIKFNTTQAQNDLNIVNDAQLCLYNKNTPSQSAITILAYAVNNTAEWTEETIQYNWTTNNFYTDVIGNITVNTKDEYHCWNVTDGTNLSLNNNSYMLERESGVYMAPYSSKENSDPPYLNITYSGPTNISDCAVLNLPGTYFLNQNITNSVTSNCIDITGNGITLDCQGNTIDSNRGSADYGILITGDNAIVKNCIISDWDGVGLYSAGQNVQVLNTVASNNQDWGFHIIHNGEFINVTANNQTHGIYTSLNDNVSIINSSFINNTKYDVLIEDSTSCDFSFENVTGTDNKPIVFYGDTTVTLSDWDNNVSEMILCNIDDSVIRNITIDHTDVENNGILLIDSSGVQFINVTVNNSYTGIFLENSDNNNFTTITTSSNKNDGIFNDAASTNNRYISITSNNNVGTGFRVSQSGNPTGIVIEDATLNSNTNGLYYVRTTAGASSSGTLIGNNIVAAHNVRGIWSKTGFFNNVTLFNNSVYGIYEDWGFGFAGDPYCRLSNSTVYNNSIGFKADFAEVAGYSVYNNFFNQSTNFEGTGNPLDSDFNTSEQTGTRIYGNGNLIGGNFWANVTGDGFSETCGDTNGDGICDTSFTFYTSTTSLIDELPLSLGFDNVAPTYSNIISSGTNKTGTNVRFNVTWADTIELSGWIFEHNQTGSYSNSTFNTTWGTNNESSHVLGITLLRGGTISWKFYANDSNNNMNTSMPYQNFTVANTAPTFNESLPNQLIYHSQTISVDVNCSDVDGDSIIYYDNTSLFNINETNGNITDNPVQGDTGNHLITITCGDTFDNTTTTFWYNVSNYLPTVASATIVPTSPAPADNLNCTNGTVADSDGDVVSLIYDWEKDGVWQGIDNFTLGAGNTSANQFWRCRITPNDGLINGSTQTSSSVSIDTGFLAPVINWTNATTAGTNIVSITATPTNNNSWVNLSVVFADANAAENWSVHFCTTDSATTSGCSVATYCSSINSTAKNQSCRWNVTSSTEDYTYYAFVVDSNDLMASSVSGTWEINFVPTTPTIVSPTDGSVVTATNTIVNFTATDANTDLINYTIYGGTDNDSLSLIYSGNLSWYNYTGLSEVPYFIRAYTTDEHGYSNLVNSSISNFSVDYTAPTVTDIEVSKIEATTADAVVFRATVTDDLNPPTASACVFTLQKSDYNGADPFNMSTTNTKVGDVVSITQNMAAYGAGTLNFQKSYCSDSVGNIKDDDVAISITITATGGDGGSATGGGGAGGADAPRLKYDYINILRIMQAAKIVLGEEGTMETDENTFITRVTQIDMDNKVVEIGFSDILIRFQFDETTLVDLNGDATPEISVRVTDIQEGQIAFYLNKYQGEGSCEENVWVNLGVREECEFACNPVTGCYFKEVGDPTTLARECGTRLLLADICIEESPIQYILSEDYFMLQGVLQVPLFQATMGVRESEGLPIDKKITVTNIDADTIFVKFVGEDLSEVAEEKIQPGESHDFTLSIFPVRGKSKGFIDMRVEARSQEVIHSIMYEMALVTCKEVGVEANNPDECCSKTADDNGICAPGTNKPSSVFIYIMIILVGVAFVAMVIYVGSSKKEEGMKFIPPK